ncbi:MULTISPECIES: IclR family transcriptional regulator [unclassified Chelatococcus]|uniref:IclR family transcriptional regulator n=1 Tax=unclassified Chelatococcus TaxID=2638111 RepID=UPI001BCD9517|nr:MULTISPECIES: IclR family transcriptional regulator [unclassified Chelatococcus]CAH1659665.1 conserved hypothetical protein [Hyphomicrobiales bacterium]MBS7740975.1 IclR family transcriptional regulator [Chelatococcus sp. HY11]MBX3545161.1 IclR family transcriptional regulator [Chelatococcus sp.]MCO5077794.1 IclR family transcriptional regulator [Chelatococcus sp.]CAH1683740.1 conserved hypothetical protein [Hyphomicrobiales bacterium]
MRVGTTLISQAVAVIELLAEEARPMRFADITGRLELPKSSAHALLSALCEAAWVDQDADTGFYRLSLRFPVLGQRFITGMGLREVFQPVLDRLARESGELARLAIVEGHQLMWTADAQGAHSGLIYQPIVNSVVAPHVTAHGRAWLATLPQEEAVKIVLAIGFGRPDDYGPRAIRSMDALLRELERTRERGYGVVFEEALPGIAAVAVAIRPHGGVAVGTVGVAGPIIRIDKARLPELVRVVRAASEDLATLWPLRSLRPKPAGV